MRTTLDIDHDVLAAVLGLARQQNRTAGEVLSALARQGLTSPLAGGMRELEVMHGFRPFPSNGQLVTNDLIDTLRDGERV